jgi:hypothetical protein
MGQLVVALRTDELVPATKVGLRALKSTAKMVKILLLREVR